MSPHKVITTAEAAQKHPFSDVGLSIMGIGSQYPEATCTPQQFRQFTYRHYPPTPILEKLLAINENTGIDTRSLACHTDDPILNMPRAPTIDELSEIYLSKGVKLAVGASRQALEEWGGAISEITHVVATTCTNSANPGYDYYVAKELGLSGTVERTLLHGVGCAGGLAALRNAANIALGFSFMERPARILIVACELASLFARSELDSLKLNRDLRIGLTIFSDGASAVVLSNGIGEAPEAKPVYELLGWDHQTIPETDKDIGFDVHPNGWKVNLSPRVPALASTSTPPLFASLLPRIPSLALREKPVIPTDFDWAVHPGGLKVLASVEKLMRLPPHLLRASHDVYKKHGNCSGAAIFGVFDRLREEDMGPGKDVVLGLAFGPGVAVEMCVLRRPGASRDTEGSTSAFDTE